MLQSGVIMHGLSLSVAGAERLAIMLSKLDDCWSWWEKQARTVHTEVWRWMNEFKLLVCLSTGSNACRCSASWGLRRHGGGGGGQARCMSEGHPGGKLGMLCCCLSSSPLGSTALPQSHNYPLLQQAYALTASETPHLSPTFCLLHWPLPLPAAALPPPVQSGLRGESTQQNLTLLRLCLVHSKKI
jgi:hypothetical protein